MSRPSLRQSQGCCMIPQYKTIMNSLFYVLGAAAAFVNKSILEENSLLTSPLFLKFHSSFIGPHKKGFWLFCAPCNPSLLTEDKGNKGSGRATSRAGWVGWVSDEGRLVGWWLIGNGEEALYGREVPWEADDMELIWFKVNLGTSAWNGLVAEGALKPKEKKRNPNYWVSLNLLFVLKIKMIYLGPIITW